MWWALSKTQSHTHVLAIAFKTSVAASIFQCIIAMLHFMFYSYQKINAMMWLDFGAKFAIVLLAFLFNVLETTLFKNCLVHMVPLSHIQATKGYRSSIE